MKPTEFIVENSIIAQEADDMHRDHEVQMARSQMYSAAQAAIEIHRLLRDVSEIEGLEGWVQSKLTLASQYLESVRDYMKYEAVSQEPEMMVFAEDAANYAVESIIKRSMKEQTPAPGTSTPVIGGMSRTVGPGGDITTRSDVGGTSVSQTKTPGGFTKQTTADYDMGGAGSASMVKSAPQQPGQLAGTTTVTRTAAVPKYDADAGIAANAPAVKPASGSAVQGVAFGGASGKNVGNNVVTTGDANLAAQAKAVMPAPNANLEEEGMKDYVEKNPEKFNKPTRDLYARNTARFGGDDGMPGAKGERKGTGPTVDRSGKSVTGFATGVSKPEGVPKVEKMPITRFGGGGRGGMSGHLGDGGTVKSLIPNFESKNSVRESATGGASSAGGIATSMGGPGHKPTSGVPKKVGNSYKSKRVAVGKGVYDK
jgi:hypothetical protein